MNKIFLTAEWRNLAIANYSIDARILEKYIPFKTELDLFENKCYLSLVGFMFQNIKVKNISIPFHRDFEESNLRFYVKHKDKITGDWKRGVVFIKEIVPKLAVQVIANLLYHEHYEALPMKHEWRITPEVLHVKYWWESLKWNSFTVQTKPDTSPIEEGSLEQFITEHYWGYTKVNEAKTREYQVLHPSWDQHEVLNYKVDVDFGNLYGKEFEFLLNKKPDSVMLAGGSEVELMEGKEVT